MKETDPIQDSPYYVNFIYYFNVQRDFYECHEHGEYLWLNSGGGDFLKGLIQLAVSLYHLGRGNQRGAAIMLDRAVRYLRQFPDVYEGIEIPSLLSGAEACHAMYHTAGACWSHNEVAAHAPLIAVADAGLLQRLENWQPVQLPEEE